MSTIKVNKIENTATADGGIAIDASGHVTVDGQQLPTAGALSNRNLIQNGDQRIDQRNNGSAVTGSGDFPVDRFSLSQAGGGAYSAQRVTDAPTGFQYSTKITTTTADSSITGSERLLYITRLEGQNTAFLEFGTANAKTITLSFYVKSSVTGTFSGAIQNGASDRSYPYNYTINTADTWEYKTVTITGDTTGTWATDNTKSHQVIWSLGNSSDRAATVNAWGDGQKWGSTTGTANTLGTLNATWFITGVQLEVGEKATPFEHRSFGDELAKCQRYYSQSYTYGTTAGTAADGGAVMSSAYAAISYATAGTAFFPQPMRAAPSVTIYSNNGTQGKVGADSTDGNGSASNISDKSAILARNNDSTGVGANVWIRAHFVASAEL